MVSNSTLSFGGVGAALAQNVTVEQANYTGGYTPSACVDTTGTTVASILPMSAGTFSVTPISAGSCTLAITGGAGAAASIGITVTTTNVIVR